MLHGDETLGALRFGSQRCFRCSRRGSRTGPDTKSVMIREGGSERQRTAGNVVARMAGVLPPTQGPEKARKKKGETRVSFWVVGLVSFSGRLSGAWGSVGPHLSARGFGGTKDGIKNCRTIETFSKAFMF